MGMTTAFMFQPAGSATTLPPLPPCRRPGLQPRRGLRVTRLADDERQPGQAGCMRIAGRLADVCAELERLAGLESGYAFPPPGN